MKIINETHWTTRNLKTMISRVCQEELLDAQYIKRLQVHVKYGKRKFNGYDDYPSGRAPYNASHITLFLPKDKIYNPALALVIAHEMAHNHGVRHRNLNNVPRYDWVKGWEEQYAWAKAYTIEKYPVPTTVLVTPLTKAQDKLASAQVLLKTWEAKKKAAINKVQKYKDSCKYYESRVMELQPKEKVS